jgi:autotransporter translocation and assembly factor TamB
MRSDDLILEEEPLAGLVQATASISGLFSQPVVNADVAVTNGAYRGFEYQRAEAAIVYGPRLVRVDGQIVQSEGVTFTARGAIPLSKDTAETLDLQIESTPVNLALAQSFTDELQDVSGTAEMNVTVTGSLSEPLLVRDAGKVPPSVERAAIAKRQER